MTTPTPTPWNLRVIRLTFFPLISEITNEVDFSNLWQNSLENIEIYSNEFKPKDQQRTIIGYLDNIEYRLEIDPIRINLVIKPKEDILVTENKTVILADLGNTEEVIGNYKTLFSSILEKNSIHFKRIAIGMILHSKGDTREETYKILAKNLPFVKISSTDFKEFRMSLNKDVLVPKIGESIENLLINKITNWAALKLDGALSRDGIEVSLTQSNYAQLELDINTDKSNENDLYEESISINEKLFEYCQSIIKDGLNE
jgi:hypothetical protein